MNWVSWLLVNRECLCPGECGGADGGAGGSFLLSVLWFNWKNAPRDLKQHQRSRALSPTSTRCRHQHPDELTLRLSSLTLTSHIVLRILLSVFCYWDTSDLMKTETCSGVFYNVSSQTSRITLWIFAAQNHIFCFGSFSSRLSWQQNSVFLTRHWDIFQLITSYF